jgi:hypothetical protein
MHDMPLHSEEFNGEMMNFVAISNHIKKIQSDVTLIKIKQTFWVLMYHNSTLKVDAEREATSKLADDDWNLLRCKAAVFLKYPKNTALLKKLAYVHSISQHAPCPK